MQQGNLICPWINWNVVVDQRNLEFLVIFCVNEISQFHGRQKFSILFTLFNSNQLHFNSSDIKFMPIILNTDTEIMVVNVNLLPHTLIAA